MLTLALSLALTLPAPAFAADPPAVPAAASVYKYATPSGEQKDLSLPDLVAAIRANKDATNYVWQPGWSAWKSWKDVPEIKAAIDAADLAVPAAAPADPVLSYTNGGEVMQLPASEVAKRVLADKTGNHLAWKAGMAAWAPAGDLPEVKTAMERASAATPPPVTKAPAVGSEPTGKMKMAAGPEAADADDADDDDDDAMEDGEGDDCCGGGMKVAVGGDVRTAFTFANLGGDISENPDTGAKGEVNRVRLWSAAELGEHAKVMASLNLGQTDDRSATSASLTGVASGWNVGMNEAYVEVGGGEKIEYSAKVGAQEVAFGVNGYFDRYDRYFVDGRSGWLSLQQRFGVLPTNDFGVGLHVGSEETWGVDVQLLNGPGVGQVEDNYGKNILGRLSLHPADIFSAWVSGDYQVKGLNGDTISYAVDGAAELRLAEVVGVLGEVQFGGEGTKDGTGYNSLGYQVAAAGYLRPSSKLISTISPVVTYQAYTPELGSSDPVGAYGINAAGNVYWNAGCDCRTVLTGLAFEMYIPVSTAEPVVSSLILQTAAKF